MGINGYFSFKLKGLAAYLGPHVAPGPRGFDTGLHRWSWPAVSDAKLGAAASQPPKKPAPAPERKSKKRKAMTFAESSDLLMTNGVRSEAEAWMLANRLKTDADDPALSNLSGRTHDVPTFVAKVRRAAKPEQMMGGTLHLRPAHPLGKFISLAQIDRRLLTWIRTG